MASDEKIVRQQDERSTRSRAHLVGVPYLDSRKLTEFKPIEGVFSVDEMKKTKMIPLVKTDNQIDFAITINTSQQTLAKIKDMFPDFNVKMFVISDSGFRELMKIINPPVVVEHEDIEIKSDGDSETIFDVSQSLDTVSSDEIVKYLVDQAVRLNVSDIHMEVQRTFVRMRFRIDGVLHPVAVMTHQKYRQIQSSIAIKAGIATSAPTAQTGHLSDEITTDGVKRLINMRIETVPTSYGQDAVIRVFSMTQEFLNLDTLGLSEADKNQMYDIIDHPHGMVMIVGPTGSGKTTTLYAVLNKLNSSTRKIITLEDPIEYYFDGISQIQVDSRHGQSFDESLRAVLRQDPDVIMLGEIRDSDTARTAIQASLTGHLVLTTFHADTAAAALSRLFDSIGGNPMFSSAVKLVVAQRLVRKLDDETKAEYTPSADVQKHIREVLADLPEGTECPSLDDIKLFKPGKSEDNPIGYKGRIIIMEQLRLDEGIQSILHDDDKRSQEAVEKYAREHGMVTLLQDAMIKALQGVTTIDEVYKAID